MQDGTTAERCRDTAAEYRRLAGQAGHPIRKSEYEVLEKKWLKLARRIEVRERENGSNVLSFTRFKEARRNQGCALGTNALKNRIG